MTYLGHFSAQLKTDLQSTRMKSTTRDDGKSRIEAGRRVRFVHASAGIRRRVRERRVAAGNSAGLLGGVVIAPEARQETSGSFRLVRYMEDALSHLDAGGEPYDYAFNANSWVHEFPVG
jgi:hypothetical protein